MVQLRVGVDRETPARNPNVAVPLAPGVLCQPTSLTVADVPLGLRVPFQIKPPAPRQSTPQSPASCFANEFGDHPDTAVQRMAWARHTLATADGSTAAAQRCSCPPIAVSRVASAASRG